MPRTETVVLGGQSYAVSQLPMRQNKEWRDALGAPVMQLISIIQNFDKLELDTENIGKLVGIVKDLLLGSMDTLLNALFAYSPTLAADRERIENECYDDEAMSALGVVIKLAYPLAVAARGLIGAGLPAMPIPTNLRSANGANGTKKPTAANHRTTMKT